MFGNMNMTEIDMLWFQDFWCVKWTFRDQFGTFKFKVHQRNENIGGFMWRSFFSLTVAQV